jgi:regulator of sigma E protease
MEQILNLLLSYILPFIFVLGLLIFFHELGHFLMAKLVGIRVERFSLGFPPRLFGKKVGDTDYCISAVPFGGYVKMSGMIDESMDKDGIKGEPWEFMSKPVWMRALVIAAGPIVNILLAALIFAGSILSVGISEPTGPVIGNVVENMPAKQAGLQEGDRIVEINSQSIESWMDMVRVIHNAPEQPLEVTWLRDGEKHTAEIVPQRDKIQDIGLIGIQPKTTSRNAGLFEAVGLGFKQSWDFTVMIFRSFGLLFSGEVELKEGLAGPVRIAQMAGDSAKGGMGSLLMFTALLSLNLGILNILPFPVLDGGHLVLLASEAVMRKPLSVKFRMVVQQIGMAILLALMVFVIVNDFMHIF